METGEETFIVNGATNEKVSNIIEKGRYAFVVKDISNFISKAENVCMKLTIDIDGKFFNDILMPEGKMEFKWRQFLYAIGIRDKRVKFDVPKSSIVGKTALVDIGIKDRVLDDGSIIKENKINFYSPIEQEIAPINGVEPEVEFKKEKKQEGTQEATAIVDDL